MNRFYRFANFAALALSLVAIPARADTPVNVCGTTITAPGTYSLIIDLNCPGATAIAIRSSNVTLKLNSHIIFGTAANWGIDVSSSGGPAARLDHVTITGPGRIQGFTRGVEFLRVDYGQISKVTVANGFLVNLRITDSTFMNINSNVLGYSQGNGLEYGNSSNGVIAFNDASGNGVISGGGIAITGVSNTLNNNVANGNRGSGILIGGSATRLFSNVTNGNGNHGIEITLTGSGNQLFHNTSAMGNAFTDLWDANANCDTNTWADNVFDTHNQLCVH